MKKIDVSSVVSAMSCAHTPVEYINIGDVITVSTLDCFSNKLRHEDETMAILSADDMNPCTGPIYVNGAVKGDILKVEILDIKVGDHGVMLSDAAGFNKYGAGERAESIHVKVEDNKIYLTDDIVFNAVPMIGCIGTAPENDSVLTTVPGTHGGNMDNTKIMAGSILLLPVYHDGALLSLGDLHAAMGDGEVTGCGIEIFGEVTLRVNVIKNVEMPLPAVITDDTFMSVASCESIDDAAEVSVKMMLDCLTKLGDLSIEDAWKIVGILANVRICQIVNALKTARCEVPISVCGKLIDKLNG